MQQVLHQVTDFGENSGNNNTKNRTHIKHSQK